MVETEVEYIFQNNQLVHVMQKVYLYYMTLMLFHFWYYQDGNNV